MDDEFPAGVEGYIDDGAAFTADEPGLVDRAYACLPLATHTMFRQVDPNEPVPRDPLLSETKYRGEGIMEEWKIYLGWLFDLKQFTISLPPHKAAVYAKCIQELLDAGEVSDPKMLEKLIGRLNTIGHILPAARHFMSRLRRRHVLATEGDTLLTEAERRDLLLWLDILRVVEAGININLTVFRKVTVTIWSDACEAGMGGITSSGLAWRFAIPEEDQGKIHINVLEYIAGLITLMIAVENSDEEFPCVLALLDNTSAVAWLKKSSFAEENPSFKIARAYAKFSIENNIRLTAEHIAGCHNPIADSLSRDLHLSYLQLAHLYFSFYPDQTPDSLRFVDLAEQHTSLLTSALQGRQQPADYNLGHSTSTLVTGLIGVSILSVSKRLEDRFSPECRSFSKEKLSKDLCPQFGTDAFRPRVASGLAQCETPSIAYRRPTRKWAPEIRRKA